MHVTIHHTGPLHLSADVCTPPLGDFLDARAVKAHAPQSAAVPPSIGAYWDEQGGVYAGLMCDEAGDYHLVVSEKSFGHTHLQTTWSTPNAIAKLSLLDGNNGMVNSTTLANLDESFPAVDFAVSARYGGHADWYLPSRWELALCAINIPAHFGPHHYWSSSTLMGFVHITGFEKRLQGLASPGQNYHVAAVRQVRA